MSGAIHTETKPYSIYIEIEYYMITCICICMVYEVEANTGINTSRESALIT